ncbi:MAG: ferredoxin reductase [Propionibacteriaceae bacterium]|nr:ferredoxin reductase [Propionibacteriaceae bacterium]
MTATATTVRRRVHRFLDLLATPLVPADYLDLINPLRPGADLRGRIVARRTETADAVTIEIRPGADWLGHEPGQHVRVGVDVNGVRHHRTYSLTSAPGEPTITITPTRIAGGIVSTHLVERSRPGDLLQLSQATGDFRVPAEAPERVLLISAGSGITPVLGMLRAGLTEVTDVVLVHCDRTAADMAGGAEVRALAEAGRLRLIERPTASAGRLTLAELGTLVGDWAERETWACGPAGLLDTLTAHWNEHGVGDQLHVERFTPPPRPAVGEGGAVTFTETGIEVEAPTGQSLLEAGEAAGVLMPSGCRMGICHRCVSSLSSGSVRDLRTGELRTAPDGDPLSIQTCVSAAAGPCHIER